MPETVTHYLMACRRFTEQRNKMKIALNKEGIHNIDVKTLLGGSQLTKDQQKSIKTHLETYIKESGRLYGLAKR